MNKPTPFLITGSCGMLGRAMAQLLGTRATALTFAHLDITDQAAVAAALDLHRPATLINCAAATDVDRCETNHAYADAGNTAGPRCLAEACAARGIRMVHVSTDFVFDGAKAEPYTEEDEPAPLGYYGLSKLRGEEAVRELVGEALVVRTSWAYGPIGPTSTNFPLKVLEWARRPGPLRVAADQFGSPTYAPHLAAGILELLQAGATGLFHLAGEGCASRWELAREVLAAAHAAAAARLAAADLGGAAAVPAPADAAAAYRGADPAAYPAAAAYQVARPVADPAAYPAADPASPRSGRPPAPARGPALAARLAASRLTAADFAVEVLPAHAADFPAPAPRPLFSCLDCSKAAHLGITLPPWREGVARYVGELLREEEPPADIREGHLPAGCAPAQGAPAAGSGETKGTTA